MTIPNTRRASMSVPVFVRRSVMLASVHIRSSSGLFRTFRDGTDPLLGGHRAGPAGRHGIDGVRGGGA
jgi:hypothetical protein